MLVLLPRYIFGSEQLNRNLIGASQFRIVLQIAFDNGGLPRVPVMAQVALDHGDQQRSPQRTLAGQRLHAFAQFLFVPVFFKAREPSLGHSALKGGRAAIDSLLTGMSILD